MILTLSMHVFLLDFKIPHLTTDMCQLQKEKLCPMFVEHPFPLTTTTRQNRLDAGGQDTLGLGYPWKFYSILVTSKTWVPSFGKWQMHADHLPSFVP